MATTELKFLIENYQGVFERILSKSDYPEDVKNLTKKIFELAKMALVENRTGDIGEIFLEEPVGIHQYIDTADDGAGNEYSVYWYGKSFGGRFCPEVACHKTGKHFLLSWNDIIDLAVTAGISEKDNKGASE